MSPFDLDHGMLNLPLHKRGGGSLDAQIDRHLAEQRRESAAESKAIRAAARQTEAERVRFTAADLAGATYVRDRGGWAKVVRVSAKSVTVETPYSWTERIPVGKVLAFRRVES